MLYSRRVNMGLWRMLMSTPSLQERLSRMNILISTPGRLLQHMDQTIAFDTSNVQMLVLDEADRCLDLGFAKTLDAIVANLPPTGPGGRQTLLFSATQSGSIASLARLSLRDPVYVSVRDKEAGSEVTDGEASTSQRRIGDLETPKGLEQHYMVVDLDRKLDILWGFIKSHLACKTLVFMSSCKQVRFVYETFRHLRPGTSLLHIHGKQKQTKRLDIFQKFTSTSHAVLFATDIAARGLDFPSVNWVVQLDCPEDVDTYVHRVGRTARYNSKGKSLLFLLPSEQDGFLQRLKDKKLDELVRPIKINPSKSSVSIQKQFQSLAFRFPEIKFLAQRAFISYTRSVHLQKDKKTFKLDQLPLDKFAAALGLPGAPKIKFVSKQQAAAKKNKERDVEKLKATLRQDSASQSEESDGPDDKYPNDDSVDEVDEIESIDSNDEAAETETRQLDGAPTEDPSAVSINKPLKTTKYDKMYRRQNQGVLSEHYNKVVEHDEEANGSSLLLGADDDQEDFITLARRQHDLPLDHDDSQSMHNGMSTAIGGDEETGMEDLSKRRLKMGMTKKGLVKLRGKGEKLIFDEEGQSHALYEMTREDAIEDVEAERRQFLENEGQRMRSIDVADKAAQKEARRDKKRKRKEREREVDGRDEGAARIAVLGGDSGGEDDSAGREDQTHQDDTEEVDHEHDSRRRSSLNLHDVETAERDEEDAEIDLEALALQALRKKVRR